MKKHLLSRSLWVISLITAMACTKERPPEMADGQDLGQFSKEELSTAVIEIGGSSDIQGLDDNTITFLRVSRVSGPQKLQFMFKDLSFVGALSQTYQIRYILNADSVVAVKVLNKNDYIAPEDREIATVDGDTVRIPLFKYKADYGKLVRSRNDLGEQTSILRFERTSFTDATHLRIDPTLEARIPIQDIDVVNSPKNLVKAEVANKEYLYRRTLQDIPNEFNYSFTGASSRLEIVKFIFKKEKVEVVRADALTNRGDNSNLDLEVLMSIPVVRYKKAIYKNDRGELLAIPKFETTDYRDHEAIAELDWSNNEILSSSSPLSYYGIGQCFFAKGKEEIANVRKDLKNGVFNFTVIGNYSSNPSLDCAGFYGADYFDTVQTNFSFKERVSFQEYVKTDEKPFLEVPYTAQKLLGFGLFTYSKNHPNSSGSIGTDGTKIPLPAIFDIKNGKKVRYILAGLPDHPQERDAILRATQEVVRDWNDGFRKALAPSKMARTDDVIQLEVENPENKGELGDIDRNYIYYVQKASNASILGLGGSHANPRSGKVEAGSVFVYGGNIKTYVDHLKRLARVKKEYNKVMQQVTVIGTAEETAGEQEANLKTMSLPSMSLSSLELQKPSSMTHLTARVTSVDLQARLLQQSYRAESFYSASSARRLGASSLEALLPPSTLTVLETFREAAANGETQNAATVAAIYNQKSLSLLGEQLNVHRSKIAALASQSRVGNQIKKNLENSNFCAFDVSEAGIGANVEALAQSEDELTDLELLVRIYKSTLAHELGHNLGLRHNFIGSYDKANYKFDEQDASERDYSSVMDYMTNDHFTYDGLGPQDVAAIRSAYTGLIELTEEGVGQIRDNSKLQSNKFIHVEDLKAELGITSWLQLNEEKLSQVSIKKYMFCSDEDAGLYPTCNRFDLGSSPQEIVKNIIQEYRSTYGYRNFRLDRIKYDYWNVGSYIGRLFSDFIRIRQFLEEGIYLAINNKSNEEYVPSLVAAIDGMQFFQEVIASPEVLPNSTDAERFVRAETQMTGTDGKKIKVSVPVELKRTEDKLANDGTDALAVRGIEFDKIIALIALTERGFGFKRYEQASLRVSYPEIERLLLLQEGESPAQTPTMSFLQTVISNQLPALSHNPINGQVFVLPGALAANASESVRVYAILGAIQFLDVNGLEEKDNLSSYFRVLSSFKAPTKVTRVAGLNESLTSQTTLKFYADPSNESAKAVIDRLDAIAQIHREKAKLTPLLQQWLSLRLEGKEATDSVTAINEVLAKLPTSVENKDFATIADTVMTIVSFAQQLHKLEQQVGNGIDKKDFLTHLKTQSNLVERVAKQEPLLLATLSMLPDLSENFKQSSEVLHRNTLQRHYGLMLSNVRLLNQIFYVAHPEYRQ